MEQIGITVIHVRFFVILGGVWSDRDGDLLLTEKPYLGQIE